MFEARFGKADRRQGDDARDLVRELQTVGEGDGAAEGMPDDDRAFQAQRPDAVPDQGGLAPEMGVGGPPGAG